jgi:hypothetical protein
VNLEKKRDMRYFSLIENLKLVINYEVDSEEGWKNVISVCYMKNIALHRFSKTYLSELYKLPWTTVYLLRRQLFHYDNELSTVEKVLIVLTKETSKVKTDVAVHCPEEFLRKLAEPMELDVNFSKLRL